MKSYGNIVVMGVLIWMLPINRASNIGGGGGEGDGHYTPPLLRQTYANRGEREGLCQCECLHITLLNLVLSP